MKTEEALPVNTEAASEQQFRSFELLISVLLRTGVTASLLLVVFGTVVSFVHHPDYVSSPTELQRLTRPGAAFPHTLREVASGLRSHRGQSIVAVGLLLLIATPVLRVAVSVAVFLYRGDRSFVIISSVVLAVLLLSFVLGKAAG